MGFVKAMVFQMFPVENIEINLEKNNSEPLDTLEMSICVCESHNI